MAMEPRIHLDKLTYLLVVLVALICILRGVTLYYWWHMPDIELSSSPAIYKGVRFPGVSFATLIIGLPCIAVLVLPILRTTTRVIFISGALVSFGAVSIIAAYYLSFNVAGGGASFFILGVRLLQISKR